MTTTRQSTASRAEELDAQRLIATALDDPEAALIAVVEHAARVAGAPSRVYLAIRDGEVVRWPVQWDELGARHNDFASPLVPHRSHGAAILERRTVHHPDVLAVDPTEGFDPAWLANFPRVVRTRTVVDVPLIRGETAIGALTCHGPYLPEIRPFSPAEIARLEDLAARIAPAVEVAWRLYKMREQEAQHTAAAAVLRTVGGAGASVERVFHAIAERAAQACGAAEVALWLVEDGRLRGRAALIGGAPAPVPDGDLPLDRSTAPGRVCVDRQFFLAHDLPARVMGMMGHVDPFDDAWVESGPAARGLRSYVAVPLLRGEEAMGALAVASTVPNDLGRHRPLIETLAAQAAIALQTARLFQELEDSHRALAEQKQQLEAALEQQTATADVLRVIASSPAEVQTVLDVVVERMGRLCGASECTLWTTDGDRLRGRAYWRVGEGLYSADLWARHPGNPIVRDQIHGRAALERRTIHVHDIARPQAGDAVDPRWAASPIRRGVGTYLATPLLRDGHAIGVLSITRHGARPFTESEVRLIESFAHQAAIAIENARLFGELRERDERRRQELERASSIQERLLPSSVEGWSGVLEMAVRFRAAVETSGDFYDVLRLPALAEGALPPLQVAVGDVAGKGMSAALVTALARSALQLSATVPTGMATPATTLRIAGQRLHRDVGSGHFVACALAVVEPPGLLNNGPLLRLSNAAQVPVLLVRDGAAREIEPPGDRLPLGTRPDGAYKDAEVELRTGDVVVFSSDGLVEAPALAGAAVPAHLAPPARTGELFGFSRLAASASHWSQKGERAEDVAAGIWSDLTAWCGEESHHDDVTLLVLRVPEAGR